MYGNVTHRVRHPCASGRRQALPGPMSACAARSRKTHRRANPDASSGPSGRKTKIGVGHRPSQIDPGRSRPFQAMANESPDNPAPREKRISDRSERHIFESRLFPRFRMRTRRRQDLSGIPATDTGRVGLHLSGLQKDHVRQRDSESVPPMPRRAA